MHLVGFIIKKFVKMRGQMNVKLRGIIAAVVLSLPTTVFCILFRTLVEKIRHAYIYTGCPRRDGQNFGRVFLMLNYTDITQNTYIQSSTVTEIMAREKCGLLGFPRTVRRR